MRIGLSSYSLNQEISAGRMDAEAAIEWAARNGAECMELVPLHFRFDDPDTGKIDEGKISSVRRHAADAGIPLVNYSVSADFCKEGQELAREIDRVKGQIDIAAALGVPRMRHDVARFRRPQGEDGVRDFDRWLPIMADAARETARYGKTLGVQVLIENHGYFVNGCDRVERVLRQVNEENYGLLLDTGNVACVDEDASAAAAQLAPLARMVHLKDFYLRTRDPGSAPIPCPGGWLRSRGGAYLRGAILGQGDLDVYAILRALKAAGYDGDIAIEFEGMESAPYACAVSIANAKRIWAEV